MADPLLGRTVAHYEIRSRLGGGGMGVVYKARDRKLDRDVALKFLPQQWSHDEGAKQRFVREAQAASATHHPNICTVHDIATAADGQLFIVMGYYEGPTLKQRLEQGPLPVDEALDIATQVADGLAKAHAQGVVHRDVKPGNLILTEDGVRIVDFGLATFVDALQLTAQGSTLGTAAYMSPEQVRGEEADARSDVWALGVVLYEMITGHVPFRGAYTEAIAYAIRNDPPAPFHDERSDVPEEIEQLVFRALHKDPAIRFASGRELARALREARGLTLPQDLRTVAVDARAAQDARAMTRRRGRRRLYAAAAVAAAMAVAGAVWVQWPVQRTHVAVAPVRNETSYRELQPYRMVLTAELVGHLAGARSVRVVPYDRLLQIVRRFRTGADANVSDGAVLDAIAAHSGAGLVIVPTLLREGDAWKARAEIRDSAGSGEVITIETDAMTSALPKGAAYDLAIQLAQRIQRHFLMSGPRRARVAEWLRGLVDREARQPPRRFEMLDDAEAFERGLDAYERMEYAAARQAFGEAAQRAPRNPLPLAWRSRVAALMRQDRDADESADRAFELSTEGLPAADRLFVEAVVADARDPAMAGERYRELVSRYPDEPAWLLELAAFEDGQGRVGAAQDAYNHALQLDAGLARPHLELCRLYSPSRLNDVAAAKQHGEAALQAYRSLGNQGGEVQARWCLSDVLKAGTDDDRRAARQHADIALQTMQSLQYPYGVARALNYVGIVALLAERDGREASGFFQKSLAGVREVGNRFLEPRLLMNLGVSYELFGERSTAVRYYRDSFALFEQLGNQQEAAWNRVNAAAILIDYGGDVEQGVRDAQNARSVFEKVGDKNFEVFARRVVASYLRYTGDHEAARAELSTAIDIARARNLETNLTQLNTELARLQFDRGNYTAARELLLQVGRGASGTDAVHIDIELARTHTRLGSFDVAAADLERAARAIEEIQDVGSLPLLNAAQGELAYESERHRDAQTYFRRAESAWVADLPEAASVEARAYSGWIESLQGRRAAARVAVLSSLEQAGKMHRLDLEALCRLFLGRMELGAGRSDEALDVLTGIAGDRETTLAPELRAQLHHWRSQALATRGDPRAAAEAAAARQALDEIRALIPEPYLAGVLARPDIRLIGQP